MRLTRDPSNTALTCTGCSSHEVQLLNFLGNSQCGALNSGPSQPGEWKSTDSPPKAPLFCPNKGVLFEGPGGPESEEQYSCPQVMHWASQWRLSAKLETLTLWDSTGSTGIAARTPQVEEARFPWDPEQPGRLPGGGGFGAGSSRNQEWEGWTEGRG